MQRRYNDDQMTVVREMYPLGPSVPENLAKPTWAYRRNAWIASLILFLFVASYCFLAGWFLLTAWRLGAALLTGANVFQALIGALCAAFMAVFLLKGLGFVQRGSLGNSREVTRQEQPHLFAFLDRLAAEAGAPRPKRVFLSATVNAGVFYDLSALNLILPTKKNLEIGLGLVNVLSLGEFKAVCAHEFGHFAQRTMAVGRWVYVARQIALGIISKRDALDDLLAWLSGIDVRIAWIGWLLRLIVWSVRSLLESAFRVVVLAERALAREMEFQADRVAVSLTGSDALIHALHKLVAADDAMDRSVAFLGAETAARRRTKDIFTLQMHVIERMGFVLGDPTHGKEPAPAKSSPAEHRVFTAELAQPPRMWLTHPPNNEREENAKRAYIPAPIDERPAWAIFENSAALREEITAALVEGVDTPAVDVQESLERLDESFAREHLQPRYHGIFYGRSAVRCAERVSDLFDSREAEPGVFGKLYPSSLATDMERLRKLNKEETLLAAIADGDLEPPGGVIRHRGREVARSALKDCIESVRRERMEVEEKLSAHDRMCRSVHMSGASRIGGGWDHYLVGLCSLLHYADHTEADLKDAHAALACVFRVVTATGRVSGEKADWLKAECRGLYRTLARVYQQAGEVTLDPGTANLLGVASWQQRLGDLLLPDPANDNLGVWLSRIDSWVNQATGALSSLRRAALDQLLVSERAVAEYFLTGAVPDPAPDAPTTPASYPTMLPGGERKRVKTLDWWTRFQTATGTGPTIARTAAALAITGGVLAIGAITGECTVVALNSLARPVRVVINGDTRLISPGDKVEFSLGPRKQYAIEARTVENQLIESFTERSDTGFATYVYNIAGAVPLATYTVYYRGGKSSEPRKLGAPRWLKTEANYVLTDPPSSISISSSDDGSRVVLTAISAGLDQNLEEWLRAPEQRAQVILAHARWDPANSPDIVFWLTRTSEVESGSRILAARLADNPDETVSLRAQQDTAKGDERRGVCQQQTERARALPANADLQYLAARCDTSDEARNRAYLEGWRKWPRNVWFAYAGGMTLGEQGSYREALAALDVTWRNAPPMAEAAAMMAARFRRMEARSVRADVRDLIAVSPWLKRLHSLETGEGLDNSPAIAFAKLAQGRLDEAMTAAKGSNLETHVLRMVAASDDPPPEAVERALALPASSATGSEAWIGGALTMRHGLNLAPYREAIRKYSGEDGESIMRFTELVGSGQIPAADEQLKKIRLESRLHAYVFGSVALGSRAPRQWRDTARFMLFSAERPYFR
jgi:Zn-dependent protease with chaperone function